MKNIITFINYFDIWGNSQDGFEVNCESIHYFEAKASVLETPQAILRLLKKNGVIKKTAKVASLALDYWDESEVEITCAKSGCPIGRLLIEA